MEQKRMRNIFLMGIVSGFYCERTCRLGASQAIAAGGQVLTGKWSVKADFTGRHFIFRWS